MGRVARAASAAVALVLAGAGAARSETFTVPVDSAQSQVTVTLTLAGGSASDTSPVAGTLSLSLATVAGPTSVTGRDFRLSLTETLVLNINYGFLGRFDSSIAGLEILYAAPGTPIGPVPIDGLGAFTFADVPANTRGVLTYSATGLVCATLQSSGLPCTDTDDLSTEPTQAIDFAATLTTSDRVVSVVAAIDRTAPIDPANPNLGTIRVVGTVRGSATVPVIPGDANGDCVVSFADVTSVLANWGSAGWVGDADSSGSVNFSDITAALANWNAACD
ncbi:MAG: hypothetical protein SFZ24_05565 [Planctomycetota bacterium]|nr:hypothetical protein [Planctomycetota bacterium]